MGADTTDLSYWLNWRFLVSALYVFGTLISAFYLIWKYEGKGKLGDERRDGRQIPDGVVYKDELWKMCLEGIHPFWLLLFRILALGVLLAFIIGNTIVDGPGIFYYYTQLTFVLTTIYFGFDICAHSVNILILGDAVLNGMRFPIFRIAYFVVWTGAFVIYQWIFHVFISLPWPYPFMELSPPYSPLCSCHTLMRLTQNPWK
ncbi:uncharacterized protein LOC141623565 isoform X2 [Silene latifolia]|uniref:uncharacterized protein LOC141623565 isoform X2 n=1 Tax=Silene latifolia TaxID=37657 RepID=UPI003D77219C